MIIPIKHRVDWELTRQIKQMQINKDNARENKNRFDHAYNFVDKVMLTYHTAYK